MWQVQWPHEGSRLARKSHRNSLRRWKSHSEWRLGTWQRNLGELCNCLQLPEKRGGMPALSHQFSSPRNWIGGKKNPNHWTYLIIISPIVFVIRVGVAHTCRWLQVQHIGNLVPAEWVLVQRGPIIVHLEGETRFTSRFALMRELSTWSQPLRETVRSPTGSHRASCNLGLRSTRAPGDLCAALSVTSQTCRR